MMKPSVNVILCYFSFENLSLEYQFWTQKESFFIFLKYVTKFLKNSIATLQVLTQDVYLVLMTLL